MFVVTCYITFSLIFFAGGILYLKVDDRITQTFWLIAIICAVAGIFYSPMALGLTIS